MPARNPQVAASPFPSDIAQLPSEEARSAAIELPAHIADGLHLVPLHMQGAVSRYLLRGIPPGSFLTALLSNDFMGAVGKADDINQQSLVGWAGFLYGYAPGGSHGSPAVVSAWINDGGLLGREAA